LAEMIVSLSFARWCHYFQSWFK